jgi:ribosomal protein L37AE/L43A
MNELVFIPVEKPTCPECKGTGKITLFTGIVECKACKREPTELPDWKPDVPQRYMQMAGRATRRSVADKREFYRALFGGE